MVPILGRDKRAMVGTTKRLAGDDSLVASTIMNNHLIFMRISVLFARQKTESNVAADDTGVIGANDRKRNKQD